jgi:hypothetical protein
MARTRLLDARFGSVLQNANEANFDADRVQRSSGLSSQMYHWHICS